MAHRRIDLAIRNHDSKRYELYGDLITINIGHSGLHIFSNTHWECQFEIELDDKRFYILVSPYGSYDLEYSATKYSFRLDCLAWPYKFVHSDEFMVGRNPTPPLTYNDLTPAGELYDVEIVRERKFAVI